MKIYPHVYEWSGKLTYGNKPRRIVIHHSATDAGTVESFHRYHRDKNGWCGIGYHYVIYKNGEVHQGRPEDSVGAHCVGANYNSIGVCMVGDFTKTMPTDEQLSGLIRLVDYLRGKYGWLDVQLHKEIDPSTACPGRYVWSEQQLKADTFYLRCDVHAPMLCNGCECDAVKVLQNALNVLSGAKLDPDGIFGELTEKAVRTFQKSKEIDVDGIVGVDTWNKLLEE